MGAVEVALLFSSTATTWQFNSALQVQQQRSAEVQMPGVLPVDQRPWGRDLEVEAEAEAQAGAIACKYCKHGLMK